MFEWLKGLRDGVWGVIGAVVALAVLAEVAIPVGHWFWAWVATGNNAMVLIAFALIGGVAAFGAQHAG